MNNNGLLRPYWVDDQIRYILPKNDRFNLRSFTLSACRLCYLVLNRIDRLQASRRDTVETKTSSGGAAHGTFLKSYEITNQIMAKVRQRVGTIPIAAFIVGTGEPYGPEYEEGFAEISRQHGILVLKDVEPAVLRTEKTGVVARAADGAHWNEVGHEIAGRAIVEGLKTDPILLHGKSSF